MSSATISYQYAVRTLSATVYPYARSISEAGYFGLYGKTVNEALLFESATKAEQAIAHRNAFFAPMTPEQFLVLPVKVTTTTVTPAPVTTTTRELA